jgi:hypothetical protein
MEEGEKSSSCRYIALDIQMHTQVVNRMHGVAHRHHLSHLKGKDLQPKNTEWQ